MKHKFILFEFEMPITKERATISACKHCGTIEVINPDKILEVCSGKMHKNSNVKQLNAKPINNLPASRRVVAVGLAEKRPAAATDTLKLRINKE